MSIYDKHLNERHSVSLENYQNPPRALLGSLPRSRRHPSQLEKGNPSPFLTPLMPLASQLSAFGASELDAFGTRNLLPSLTLAAQPYHLDLPR